MTEENKRAFDVGPEDELISLLRAEGASDEFLVLLETDPEEAGVERNSCRSEINKWIRWNDGEISEDALERPGFGGGFFEKMWRGDLYAAYNHADMNNKALLKLAFGISRINSDRPVGYSEVTA